MKQFEEQFSKNVKNAFAEHREPFDEKAWEDIKARLQRKKKTRLIALFSYTAYGAAAVVLLLLGSLWFFNSYQSNDIDDVELVSEKSIGKVIPGDKNAYSGQVADSSKDDNESIIIAEPIIKEQSKNDNLAQKEKQSREAELPKKPDIVTKQIEIATVFDDVEENSFHYSRDLPVLSQMINLETSKIIIIKDANPLISKFSATEVQQEINTTGNDTPKRSQVEISAGTMLPFAETHISKGYGFSAGLVNSWEISSLLSISTGGLLTYNRFNYDESKGLRGYSRTDLTHNETSSYNKSSDFELLAVDVPLNAKISVMNSKNSQMFISAGISSFIYLKQSFSDIISVSEYQYDYDPESDSYTSSFVAFSYTEDETVEAFSRFDLARFLNISFGYQVIREKQSLMIEPFIKFPLGKITSRNINLGMSGLMVKYSF